MPPKRGLREDAPTRQSRRLRKAQDSEESPLRSLSTERKARRQATPPEVDASSEEIISVMPATSTPASIPSTDRTVSKPSHFSQHPEQSAQKANAMESAKEKITRKAEEEKTEKSTKPQTPPKARVQAKAQQARSPKQGSIMDGPKSVVSVQIPSSRKRLASPVEDMDENIEQRPNKIRRSTASALTPVPRNRIARPIQSARVSRTTHPMPEIDVAQLSHNIIDPNTEFGRHHSQRLEAKLRKQRTLRKRSMAADALISGGVNTQTATNDNREEPSDGSQTFRDGVQGDTSRSAERVPADSTPSNAQQTPSRSGWGLGSVLGKVGSALSFGYSIIRPSPARHESSPTKVSSSQSDAETISISPIIHDQANTPTPKPATSNQIPNTDPEQTSPASSLQDDDDGEEDEGMPVTPTPSHMINNTILSSDGKRMPKTSTPARTRTGYQERIRKMQEKKRKVEAAEAARRQAMWDAQTRQMEEEEQKTRKYFLDHPVPQSDIKEVLRRREQGLQAGFKRKFRVDDLVEIPRPKDGSFDVFSYFEEESDGEEYCYVDEWGWLTRRGLHDVINTDELARPTTTKKVRFAENLETGPTPSKPTWALGPLTPSRTGSLNDVTPSLASALKTTTPSLISGDPNRAQPYLGTMFAETLEKMSAEKNVFGTAKSQVEPSSITEEEKKAIAYGQKYHVWTGPKIVPRPGSFTVPDDSDSDEESEDGESESPDKGQDSTASLPSDENTNSKKAETSATPSTPSKNIFGATNGLAPTPSDANALARARSQAEKYKPKTPSALRASSRLSASPVTGDMSSQLAEVIRSTNDTEYSITPSIEKDVTAPASVEAPTTAPAPVTTATTATNLPGTAIDKAAIEYAQNLADQVPLAEVPASTFKFPSAKPAPWDNLVTPEIDAALDAWFARPEADEECNEIWRHHYATYQQEKVSGLHNTSVAAAVF